MIVNLIFVDLQRLDSLEAGKGPQGHVTFIPHITTVVTVVTILPQL